MESPKLFDRFDCNRECLNGSSRDDSSLFLSTALEVDAIDVPGMESPKLFDRFDID